MPIIHAATRGKILYIAGQRATCGGRKQALHMLTMMARVLAGADAMHLVMERSKGGQAQFWHRPDCDQIVAIVGTREEACLHTASAAELQKGLPNVWERIQAAWQLQRGLDAAANASGPEATPEDDGPPPAAIFGTVTGSELRVGHFRRAYGRPAAARLALLRMAAAMADGSLGETGSQHEYNDGTHTLSIVLCGQDVFVLPVLKSNPSQIAACQQMTWPRFRLEHPEAAADLEQAMRRHHEAHPGETVPDHVMALYPESPTPNDQPACGARTC
ncbi:MAG: hypothetical protein Q4B17_13450 [Lautropia sp.]|nr:hypothetical protein [Lautropia sp.]